MFSDGYLSLSQNNFQTIGPVRKNFVLGKAVLLLLFYRDPIILLSRSSQTGVHIPAGVHFDFSSGTLHM